MTRSGRPTLTITDIMSLGQRTSEGCLLWPRGTNGLGYGRVRIHGRLWVVHRFVWTELRGEIPEGITLDHECHNRAARKEKCQVPEGECPHRRCYELGHLVPREQCDNWSRGNQGGAAIHRAKTHCPQGHPYSGENLYVRPNGERCCRQCRREDDRHRKEMKRLSR